MIRANPAPMLPGETLGAFRKIDGEERATRVDSAWAAGVVAPFPLSWVGRILTRWRDKHRTDPSGANMALLGRSRMLLQSWAVGLSPDAGEGDIKQCAKDSARDFERKLRDLKAHQPAASEGAARLLALLAVGHWMAARNLDDQWQRLRKAYEGAACLLRVQCEKWWSLALKKLHARTAEGCAIDLRMVHKRGECYVSTDGVKARRAQLANSAAMMASTHAVNDAGQAYRLAELAATGTANKEIRRAELMTRIAGFDLIAVECGHLAEMITVTCPSRMHSMRTKGSWGTEENPAYDGTKPGEAQAHQSAQWAKCRAFLGRHGAGVYGFRIAEPNHDGTPHWHLLLFYPPASEDLVRKAFKRYFLDQVDPNERGAAKHRISVERVDRARGSAASYIAKYVSKNIDGYRVEKDLHGNDALTASERVQAWAARWRIRQFQQIGGPPVGVWRELRRLNPEALDGSEANTLHAALKACNTSQRAGDGEASLVERHVAARGWKAYCELQGGPMAGRAGQRVVLQKELTGELGRYGEPMPARTVGVAAMGEVEQWVPMPLLAKGGYMHRRRAMTTAQSERHQWMVVPGVSLDEAKRIAKARGEAVRPWTRVNNCTAPPGTDSQFAPLLQVRPKVGRVRGGWVKRPALSNDSGESSHHERPPDEPSHRQHRRVGPGQA